MSQLFASRGLNIGASASDIKGFVYCKSFDIIACPPPKKIFKSRFIFKFINEASEPFILIAFSKTLGKILAILFHNFVSLKKKKKKTHPQIV